MPPTPVEPTTTTATIMRPPRLKRTTTISSDEISGTYKVEGLRVHEFPVIGLVVHPRILPGFLYRVRPLTTSKYLFSGKALQLLSIGQGYGKRITFKPDSGTKNENSNYFWSDSYNEGFGFEIEVISPGDKFTMYDAAHKSFGNCQVLRNKEPQIEQSHLLWPDGTIEKWVLVNLCCKIQTVDGAVSTGCISGMAIASKASRSASAKLVRVMNCHLDGQQKKAFSSIPSNSLNNRTKNEFLMKNHNKGFSLEPGVDCHTRRIQLDGNAIGDIPTSYIITSLNRHELPVIGTYVDSRVLPGFHYTVRPAHAKNPLFNGDSLKLLSIGLGYGKRFTFESKTKNINDHYFWSDSYNEGFGFAPHEVIPGQKFKIITSADEVLGTAIVKRSDRPQVEIEMAMLPNGGVLKRLRIEIVCHLVIDTNVTRHCRVCGIAVVIRDSIKGTAKVQKIENPGFDSQALFHHVAGELLLNAYE